MQTGRLLFEESGPKTEGLSLDGVDAVELVPGPLPGVGAAKIPEDARLGLTLEKPLGPRGGIAFWLLNDTPRLNGLGAETWERTLLTAEDLFELRLGADHVCTKIAWRFAQDVWGVSPVLVPGLPGPQWLHLAFCWDADAGVFEGFLNGTPLRLPGTRIRPWRMSAGQQLALAPGAMAIADLRVHDAPFAPEDMEKMLPALYRGALDAILGARDRGALDAAQHRGAILYENPLAGPDDVADWVMEGPGLVSFQDGWMTMKSLYADDPDRPGHFVFWPPRDFPRNFLAEWEIQPLSEYGLCIVFIAAQGRSGQDLFAPALAPRDGAFQHYVQGDVNCYHMSYYANTPFNPGRITCNMRKNSGFHLVDNGPPGIPPGSGDVHAVSVLRQGARVELAVDGRRIVRFVDDGVRYGPPLGGGKIGLRQMQWMEARYRNFRVHALPG